MLHKWILYSIALLYCTVLSAKSPNVGRRLVTGQSVANTSNTRDILHPRNNKVRMELMQNAVFNALEKGSDVIIDRKTTNIPIPKTNIRAFEKEFDQHVRETIRSYKLHWTKASEYKFTEIDKRKWHCEVSGYVWKQGAVDKGAIRANFKSVDRRRYINPQYTITHKSFNTVHINANGSQLGRSKKLVIVDPLESRRLKSKKTEGYIYITKSYGDYSKGKIIKGMYNIKEGNTVQAKYFNIKRSSFRYEYSVMPSQQVNFRNINELNFDLTNKEIVGDFGVAVHTIMYSTQNLKTNTRWGLGVDLYNSNLAQGDSMVSVTKGGPKLSFGYYIPIIPEYLFITPHVGLGYLFLFKNDPVYIRKKDPWNINVTTDFGVSASLRLGNFDIIGGVRYRYINDFPQFNNTYPYFGLSYSVSKM